MRFHKIANVNKALQFIEGKGVKLVSIGAEGKYNNKYNFIIYIVYIYYIFILFLFEYIYV